MTEWYTDVHQAVSAGCRAAENILIIIHHHYLHCTHQHRLTTQSVSHLSRSDTVTTFNKLFIKDPAFLLPYQRTCHNRDTKRKRPFILLNNELFSTGHLYSLLVCVSLCLGLELSQLLSKDLPLGLLLLYQQL